MSERHLSAIQDYLHKLAWDMPIVPDEMRIPSYDANANPTQIDYYKSGVLVFTHDLTWDGDGNLTIKKLIYPL